MQYFRLSSFAPDLVDQLNSVDDSLRFKVALAVSSLAIQKSGYRSEFTDYILKNASSCQFGEEESQKVLSLVEQLDSFYYDILDAYNEGKTREKHLFVAFSKARAVHSLYFALSEDSLVASCEAIYEANAAINNIDLLNSTIHEIINSQNEA